MPQSLEPTGVVDSTGTLAGATETIDTAESTGMIQTSTPTEPSKPSDIKKSEPISVIVTTGTLADAPATIGPTTQMTEVTTPTKQAEPYDMPVTSKPIGVVETTGTLADARAIIGTTEQQK
eukprot:Platyproteum_vivax@DN668_c0_g1_i1.p1